MNLIDLPMDKKIVDELSTKVLDNVSTKIKDELTESFYEEMSSYIHEHYDNARDTIEHELLDKLVITYVNDPNYYKFKELRIRIFEDNKEKILPSLTDQAIQDSIENIVERYTHKDSLFAWRWFDGLAQFMCDHFELFANNERFNEAYTRKINNLNAKIMSLKAQLGEHNANYTREN